jgi:hypothetical protein
MVTSIHRPGLFQLFQLVIWRVGTGFDQKTQRYPNCSKCSNTNDVVRAPRVSIVDEAVPSSPDSETSRVNYQGKRLSVTQIAFCHFCHRFCGKQNHVFGFIGEAPAGRVRPMKVLSYNLAKSLGHACVFCVSRLR